MSNLLINRTRLRLGTLPGNKKEIVSSDAVTLSRTRTINPVPTRGQVVQQLGAFVTRAHAATCPSDAYHDAIFREMPHRLYFDAMKRGAGSARTMDSGEGTCSLTLNLPSGAPASWSVGVQVDGSVASSAAPTTPDAIAVTQQYTEEQCSYYFGDGSDLIDLTDHSQGGTVVCSTQAVQTNRRTGLGVQGTASDAVAKGLSATLNITEDDVANGVLDQLIDMQTGIFVVRRHDAGYGYAFPASVADLSLNASVSAVATIALNFAQAPGGKAVAGSVASSGSLAPSSGEEGYIVDVTGTDITRVTSSTTIPTNGFGIKGSPLEIV